MKRSTRREPPNNAIDADSEKRRTSVAPLFTFGHGERYASGDRDYGR